MCQSHWSNSVKWSSLFPHGRTAGQIADCPSPQVLEQTVAGAKFTTKRVQQRAGEPIVDVPVQPAVRTAEQFVDVPVSQTREATGLSLARLSCDRDCWGVPACSARSTCRSHCGEILRRSWSAESGVNRWRGGRCPPGALGAAHRGVRSGRASSTEPGATRWSRGSLCSRQRANGRSPRPADPDGGGRRASLAWLARQPARAPWARKGRVGLLRRRLSCSPGGLAPAGTVWRDRG